jgi:hypothetical protein
MYKYITRHYRANPTNCGERHCIIPADYQEEHGRPQRLRLDVSATRLPGGLEITLHWLTDTALWLMNDKFMKTHS